MIGRNEAKSLWSYNPIPTGCVLFLPFWHPSLRGDVFKSTDPIGHTATVTGVPVGAEGRVFDASASRIILPHQVAFNITTVVSLEAWVNFTALTGDHYIIRKGDDDTAPLNWGMLASATGYIGFQYYNGAFRTLRDTSIQMTAGSWYHVVALYDGANARLYVNGVAGDAPAQAQSLVANSENVQISGSHVGTDITSLNGTIAELYVYNRVLSPAEILYKYNHSYPRRFQ